MSKTLFCVLLCSWAFVSVALAEDTPSIKFTPNFRIWNCPLGYTDVESCEFRRDSLPPQQLFLTEDIMGFKIGKAFYTRTDAGPSYFQVYLVMAPGGEESLDEYILGMTAGFHATHDKNPLMEVDFVAGQVPLWLHHHTGTQVIGDREIAVSIELSDITVSQTAR